MPYMISLIPLGFFFEEKKEKKDANSEQGLCQSKYTRKRDTECAVAAAGLFIKQRFQALPAVIMVWNYFLFFLSFIYTFQTYITSLSSEPVTTSMNHYKPWYFLFLAVPCFKTLMQPCRVPAITDASSSVTLLGRSNDLVLNFKLFKSPKYNLTKIWNVIMFGLKRNRLDCKDVFGSFYLSFVCVCVCVCLHVHLCKLPGFCFPDLFCKQSEVENVLLLNLS